MVSRRVSWPAAAVSSGAGHVARCPGLAHPGHRRWPGWARPGHRATWPAPQDTAAGQRTRLLTIETIVLTFLGVASGSGVGRWAAKLVVPCLPVSAGTYQVHYRVDSQTIVTDSFVIAEGTMMLADPS